MAKTLKSLLLDEDPGLLEVLCVYGTTVAHEENVSRERWGQWKQTRDMELQLSYCRWRIEFAIGGMDEEAARKTLRLVEKLRAIDPQARSQWLRAWYNGNLEQRVRLMTTGAISKWLDECDAEKLSSVLLLDVSSLADYIGEELENLRDEVAALRHSIHDIRRDWTLVEEPSVEEQPPAAQTIEQRLVALRDFYDRGLIPEETWKTLSTELAKQLSEA